MRKGRQPLTAWTRRAAGRIRRALGGRTVGAVSALLTGTGIALLAAALSGTASSPSTRPVVAPGARAPGDRGPARSPGWKYIVIHHSATRSGNARIFDEHHRRVRGWYSLGYHFVIGNGHGSPDGAVEIGERWLRQEAGAHAGNAEYNARGIGICLVGNFEETSPTQAQLAAAANLCAELCERYGIEPARILGHRDIRGGGDTLCPGRNFPMAGFVERVARLTGRSRLLSAVRSERVVE